MNIDEEIANLPNLYLIKNQKTVNLLEKFKYIISIQTITPNSGETFKFKEKILK
jgi:hypothetical protein